MPRVKLSEYRSKHLLFEALGKPYSGLSIDLDQKNYARPISKLSANRLYVVKVDQAIKKRGKSGLIKIKRTKDQVINDLKKIKRNGFRFALVEPYLSHDQQDEHYLAMIRRDEDIKLGYSPFGGVDIEDNADSVRWIDISEAAADFQPLGLEIINTLNNLFLKNHMTLLEINPLLVQGEQYLPLDVAIEVDNAASFFVDGVWSEADIREPKKHSHQAELVIEELNAKSPASLSCKVLNEDGSLFLLLSGGGASVVVADELSQRGLHQDIANYGEYSGNPSEDETYIYTKEILNLMLKSRAPKKVLIIAGGVANFTDVAKTFAGIIRAMSEAAGDISRQKIKVFVRRGGPNQQKGLEAMSRFLDNIGINHAVYGPDRSLAKVVSQIAREAG